MDNQISSITSSLKWWEEAKNESPEESSLRLLPRPVNDKRKNQCLNKPRPSRAYKSKESAAFFSPRSLFSNTSNKQTPTCYWGKIIPNKTSTQNCVINLPPSHGFPLNWIHVLSHFSVQIKMAPPNFKPVISSPSFFSKPRWRRNQWGKSHWASLPEPFESDGNTVRLAFLLAKKFSRFPGMILRSKVVAFHSEISGGLVTWG